MSDQKLIWDSLEAAAAHCEDLVPQVYARLFAVQPQIREIFALRPGEPPNIAMGGMVNELIILISDGIDNGVLDLTIMSTLITHFAWGIDLEMYQALLCALSGAVRDACGDSWTNETMLAWRRRTTLVMDSLRDNLATIVQHQSIAVCNNK